MKTRSVTGVTIIPPQMTLTEECKHFQVDREIMKHFPFQDLSSGKTKTEKRS